MGAERPQVTPRNGIGAGRLNQRCWRCTAAMSQFADGATGAHAQLSFGYQTLPRSSGVKSKMLHNGSITSPCLRSWPGTGAR
jgi:hypothetical protein